MYLHDEQSRHRVLAIELCSRGFQVWQHYVDAMDILRALFALATNWSKQAITSQNVGAQARLAVLQIASSSTPLFMTTLGLDILHPRSVEHRKTVMQIFAFLIRKVRVGSIVLFAILTTTAVAAIGALPKSATVDGSGGQIVRS
jgi:WD repeat-containing protein 7